MAWTEGVPDIGGLLGATHADGVWIATGYGGILRSEDGLAWEQVYESGETEVLDNVAPLQGGFVAAGSFDDSAGTTRPLLLWSSDGNDWQPVPTDEEDIEGSVSDLAATSDRILATVGTDALILEVTVD
ncbi:hypothetical protein BH20CHL6_BH20CHL6_20490 [soil metagenome]